MARPPTLAAAGAVLVLLNGLWHLLLWQDRYRDLPDQVPGVEIVQLGFPVQALVSVVLAVLLVAWPRRIVVLAAIVLELGSLFALVDARTATVLGWEENMWDNAAVGVLVVEILAVVVLGALLASTRALGRTSDRSPPQSVTSH
ncbi:MAG: hypothetical protein H0U89_07170 [Acidimicrobiia bacterium]|nr:hypothetical protein [Acidimicrobiia bacterium]